MSIYITQKKIAISHVNISEFTVHFSQISKHFHVTTFIPRAIWFPSISVDFLDFRHPQMAKKVSISPVILFGSSYCSYYWDLIEIFRFEILGFTVWIMLKMFWFLVVFVELIEGFCVRQRVDLIYLKIGGWNDQNLAGNDCRRDRQSDVGTVFPTSKSCIPRLAKIGCFWGGKVVFLKYWEAEEIP